MSTELRLTALVVGATGATGSPLIKHLLNRDEFVKINIIGRREFNLTDFDEKAKERVKQFIIDLDKMETLKDELGNCDTAFSCLGTTRRAAGSAEMFKHIDHDLNVKFAELSKQVGVKYFNLVSSQGANANSWFLYLKTKGETEEEIKKLEFTNYNIFRPGFLDRGEKIRFTEKMAKLIVKGIPTDTVAKSMVNLVLKQVKENSTAVQTKIFNNNDINELVNEN